MLGDVSLPQSLPQNPGAAAKQLATAAADKALDQFPNSEQTKAVFENAYDIIKDHPLPEDLTVPAATAWGVEVLNDYLKKQGIPTGLFTGEDIKDIAAGTLQAELSQYGIPTDFPKTKAELAAKFKELTSTAIAAQTGIDPSIIGTTWDALKDGKISYADCENIGAAAGAVGGAAVASAFGIPPVIGSAIGEGMGRMVGGTVGQIFGIGGDPWAADHALFDQGWASIVATRDQAIAICTDIRQRYWDAFDSMIQTIEYHWEKVEGHIGWSFPLRYFGPATTTSLIRAYNPQTHSFDGPYLNSHGTYCYDRSEITVAAGGGMTRAPQRYCSCIAPYGCLYPPVPGSLAVPDEYTRRVVEAFLLRGAVWVPPTHRDTGCSFPLPEVAAALDGPLQVKWVNSLKASVATEGSNLLGLRRLMMIVVGDLTQTAAMVAAEKGIYDRRATLVRHGLQLKKDGRASIAAARRRAASQSRALNWVMLCGGVGLGVYAWRQRG